jgi:hypothetical protein
MIALRPCPGCARHVRVSESACPFCSAWLDAAFRTFSSSRAPVGRLSRAALFALGAGGLVVACGSGEAGGPSSGHAEPRDGAVALSPTSDAATPMPDGGDGDGMEVPDAFLYEEPEAAPVQYPMRDASVDRCVMIIASYGIGPIEPICE